MNVLSTTKTLLQVPVDLWGGWSVVETDSICDDALQAVAASQERLREASAKRQAYASAPPVVVANCQQEDVESSMELLDFILYDKPCRNLEDHCVPPNVSSSTYVSISVARDDEEEEFATVQQQQQQQQQQQEDQQSVREAILIRAQCNAAPRAHSASSETEMLPSLQTLLRDGDDDDDEEEEDNGEKKEEKAAASAPPVLQSAPPTRIVFVTEAQELAARDRVAADFDLDALLSFSTTQDDEGQNGEEMQRHRAGTATSGTAEANVGLSSWAVTTPLDESLFDALRPRMAMQFSFELDFFQKQAVMRLERRESVFVAAHTSAGKTVVAEYAIAMSQRHHSRTIYTSPIKALSNQKYRDFRDKFGSDVGILTGDVSVNPEAACLIMTTEILRSMLYRGSDVVRDIEWVIFDEVHYVNDAERGVVWEEVIIMLPDHIGLVFLSATTPNTVEFCDWIGRTKRRKIFITSTPKRPVPLQHFLLYDDEYFRLMSAETGFNTAAVSAAAKREKDKLKPKAPTSDNASMKQQREEEKLATLAAQQGKSVAAVKAAKGAAQAQHKHPSSQGQGQGQGGAGTSKRVDMAGSKAQWLSLLRVLRGGGRQAAGGLGAVDFGIGPAKFEMEAKARAEREGMDKWEKMSEEFRRLVPKKEYERLHVRADDEEGLGGDDGALLPVVIFCFSKKKCEEICDHMNGQDLLVAREKNVVRRAFIEVRQRLGAQDQRLPQLLRLEETLSRGVGVHHGGLLPLLKETVEILFAAGVVKVLVATETFAMGVNMPARSVVFNGFRKHDGRAFRDLFPGEYTQMAGRAGRRGLDKVGTVIVAAWSELPAEVTVKQLLTGSATKLSSQFRLSYSMILNLLRVNDLSVEEMIKKSFSEFHTQRQVAGIDMKKRLLKAEALVGRLEQASEEEYLEERAERHLVEAFEAAFSSSQRATASQLRHLLSLSPPQQPKKELANVLVPGCVGWIHHPRHRASASASASLYNSSPSLAVVLLDPDATAAQRLAATPPSSVPVSASRGAGLGLGLGLGLGSGQGQGQGQGPSLSTDPGEVWVWVLEWLPCEPSHSLFSPHASAPASAATSEAAGAGAGAGGGAAGGWSEVEAACAQGGGGELCWYRIACVPLSAFGCLVQEKIPVPALSSASASASASASVRNDPFAPRAVRGAPPAEQQKKLPCAATFAPIALHLHALASRCIAHGQYSSLPSLSFVDRHEALPSSSSAGAATQVGRAQLPLLDVPKETRVQSIEAVEAQLRVARGHTFEHLAWMFLSPQHAPLLQRRFTLAHSLAKAKTRAAACRHYASAANLALFPDYQQRLAVLRMLEYVDRCDETVTLKGRVACEMNTCNELLASEAIFNNVLEPLSPTEAAALLSALVFQEKGDEDDLRLTPRMETAKEQMRDILTVITELQDAEGVVVNEDLKPALNFGAAAVVYAWARGDPFKDITAMTGIQEGSIVRCITRLDELLKDVRNAARVIGNPSLYRKMVAASLCVRRDIVFAASLYIS